MSEPTFRLDMWLVEHGYQADITLFPPAEERMPEVEAIMNARGIEW